MNPTNESDSATGVEQRAPEDFDSPILICGCGHSGTSLLANMFAAHPDVYVPLRETNLFLAETPERAAEKFSQLQAEAREAGAKYLVEKTPRHIREMETIREIVPRPRFVIVVRDGRDVAASIARRRDDKKVKPGIRRWIKDNRITARERTAPDVHVYKHERLVENPTKTLKTICRFTGVPFDEQMLSYHQEERLWFHQEEIPEGDPEKLEHNALRNWQVNQPIFDSSGRWKRELTEEDLKPLIDGRGKKLMRKFGYL